MTIVLEDQRAAQRILERIANRTIDLGAEVCREPVAKFRSKARLAEELDQVFKSTLTPFCPFCPILSEATIAHFHRTLAAFLAGSQQWMNAVTLA